MIFCTLFDSYYLDKGIALYRSLEAVSSDFKLYIFCFDDKAYDVLQSMSLGHAVLVKEKDILTPELIEKKKERSKAEFCWTCTPVVISYVLDHFGEDNCTYIDSDLCFYSDPQILFDEAEEAGADAVIVEHRFKNNDYGRHLEERNGRFCVEFNYFRQTENSRRILKWWVDKCMEWCYDQPEEDRMGDQKYLNRFPELFENVHILHNKGGGVAPWNLERYTLQKCDGNDIILNEDGEDFRLIFYHFQNIRYMPGRKVNIKSQTKNKKLKYVVYIPYLKELEGIRRELSENYGISYEDKGIIRSSNRFIGFLQKHFAAFKLQSLSDVIRLDRLDDYLRG